MRTHFQIKVFFPDGVVLYFPADNSLPSSPYQPAPCALIKLIERWDAWLYIL